MKAIFKNNYEKRPHWLNIDLMFSLNSKMQFLVREMRGTDCVGEARFSATSKTSKIMAIKRFPDFSEEILKIQGDELLPPDEMKEAIENLCVWALTEAIIEMGVTNNEYSFAARDLIRKILKGADNEQSTK